MTIEERNTILELAVKTYGRESQRDMMIEEMSELTKALLKERRVSPLPLSGLEDAIANIREEMADVQIMLDQLRIIYGSTEKAEAAKLKRLAGRLGYMEPGFTVGPGIYARIEDAGEWWRRAAQGGAHDE